MSSSSCGYRLMHETEPLAVAVPFIQGDKNGDLTRAVIEEISKCHMLTYGGDDSALIVKISFKDELDDPIGYKYRTNDINAKTLNKLSSTQSRYTLVVQVDVVHAHSLEEVIPSFVISEFIEYDYADSQSFNDLAFTNRSGRIETVLNQSLGQLDAKEDATVVAKKRLYRLIAAKIAQSLDVAASISTGSKSSNELG